MTADTQSNQTVSIIVPCYNGEAFVDRCMRSIYIQNYPNIEIIAVDDGSTDHSLEKLSAWEARFQEKNMRLRIVHQENRGLGGAINTGLKYVTGAYLSLLDIDDEYLPNAVKARAEYLSQHPDVDVVRSNGWYVSKDGKSPFISDQQEKEIDNIFVAFLEGKTNNWAGSYMVRASALFRFYPDREIYTSRYGQNLQLLLPLVYQKQCGYIDEPHMNYNQQEDSLSKASEPEKAKQRRLENMAGYRDIRIYMVNQVVKDSQSKARFLALVNAAYWRSIMITAIFSQDRALMQNAYAELCRLTKPQIDDKITYNRLLHPTRAFFLRVIRKVSMTFRAYAQP